MGTFVDVQGSASKGDPFNGVYSQSVLAYEGDVSAVAMRPPASLRDDARSPR